MRTENHLPSAVLLDSGGGWLGDGDGGCLIFNKPEFTIFSAPGGAVLEGGGKKQKISGDPVREVEKLTSGGYVAVGFFGYEYLENTDDGMPLARSPRRKKTGTVPPPAVNFHFYPETSVSRHAEIPEPVFPRSGNTGRGFFPRCRAPASPAGSQGERFVKNVEKIKSHIRDGDVYQVNISEMWKIPPPQNPYGLFLNLFRSQPVPFASYMDFGRFQFLSGSMELFLAKSGGSIVSRPIKGTVRRGANPEEDLRMKGALSGNEKEKAEILMITDLVRNDLSRICVPSTVCAEEVFGIRRYETLFHMESEVRGTLREEISFEEIIKKTFPPGSVTGAPKTNALRIIDALEPHPRGPYCGAAGVFYPNGDFCLSVSIRCLQISDGEAVCWSGAGVVWDSDAYREFEEIKLKLKALENSAAGGDLFRE